MNKIVKVKRVKLWLQNFNNVYAPQRGLDAKVKVRIWKDMDIKLV